jgi:hypothetical protein
MVDILILECPADKESRSTVEKLAIQRLDSLSDKYLVQMLSFFDKPAFDEIRKTTPLDESYLFSIDKGEVGLLAKRIRGDITFHLDRTLDFFYNELPKSDWVNKFEVKGNSWISIDLSDYAESKPITYSLKWISLFGILSYDKVS